MSASAPRSSGWLLLLALLAVPSARGADLADVTFDGIRVDSRGWHTVTISAKDALGESVAWDAHAYHFEVDGQAAHDLRVFNARELGPPKHVTIVVDAGLVVDPARSGLARAIGVVEAWLGEHGRIRLLIAGSRVRTVEFSPGGWDGAARRAGEHAGQGSRLFEAVLEAIEADGGRPDRPGAGAILVWTRGADEGSAVTPLEVSQRAQSGVRLAKLACVLVRSGAVPGSSEGIARAVARAQGWVEEVPDPEALAGVVRDQLRALDRRWIATFRAPDWDRRAAEHELRLLSEAQSGGRVFSARYPTRQALVSNPWTSVLVWVGMGLVLSVVVVVLVIFRPREQFLLVHDADTDDGLYYQVFLLPITLGCDRRNDIRLREGRVSRNHLILRRRGRGVELRDLNSENGTFVNGERVTTRILEDADRISLGPAVHLVYEDRSRE